jgi:Reverse transcriptase (RNA-dependent DNA polymerase)
MTVAVQFNAVTDTVKYRPCIDLSRHVNNYIDDMSVKLDNLTTAQNHIAPGDYMVALDLENQFFQICLHPDMKKFLGFAVPEPDGYMSYYQFTVMPNGCKPAVAIVTRLLKPVKAFLHNAGVKFTIYVDDGRISASSSWTCKAQLCLAIHVLQLAGWKVQWKKTITTPKTHLLHNRLHFHDVLHHR